MFPVIEKTLEEIGLKPKEGQVYMTVLKNGKIAAGKVASLTGINRTLVYAIAKKLIAMRLLDEEIGGKKNYLVARPLERLMEVVDHEQVQLEKKRHAMRRAIEELKPFTSNSPYSVPKIRFVEEGDVEKHIKEMMPEYIKALQATDHTVWGFQDHLYLETYEHLTDWQWETAPPDIEIKLLTNKSIIENNFRERYQKRHIKFWNGGSEFTSTIWIVGDYIVMLSMRERPHYLVQIHDPAMAHNFRVLFKGLWKEVD